MSVKKTPVTSICTMKIMARACEACNRSPREGRGWIDRLFFKLLLSRGAIRNRHPTFSHDTRHESLNSTALQQSPVSHSNRRLESAPRPGARASTQRTEFELGGLFKFHCVSFCGRLYPLPRRTTFRFRNALHLVEARNSVAYVRGIFQRLLALLRERELGCGYPITSWFGQLCHYCSPSGARTFASAEEFLACDDCDETACLILDVRLPGMSGIELQKELSKTNNRLPIVFVTAHGDASLRDSLMRAGAAAFLYKPVRSDALLKEIRKALDESGADNEP
jgi:CheY-like chemotaxis protein